MFNCFQSAKVLYILIVDIENRNTKYILYRENLKALT